MRHFDLPLRVLLVTARPEGAGFIAPRSVARGMLDALEALDGAVQVDFLRPPTLAALDEALCAGRTKDVYVHYILSAGTVEDQIWNLIGAKAAAQRAVFDKEALYKSVEQVMAEAVSAQMQVAQAVIEIEREPLSEPVPQAEPSQGHEKITQ